MSNSKNWGSGSTRAWRKVRAFVLDRDRYRCQLKIEGKCETRADCVHHTRGKKFGDDPAYLVASCTPCNQFVGDPTQAKYGDPEPKPSRLLEQLRADDRSG